jgi:hypothetical protein
MLRAQQVLIVEGVGGSWIRIQRWGFYGSEFSVAGSRLRVEGCGLSVES